MRFKFKPGLLKIRRKPIKWIILHHTSEMYHTPDTQIDNKKPQIDSLYKYAMEKKDIDINYHFVIEEIKEDFQVVMGRPVTYLCDWNDIDININERAVHVGFMGSYDFKVPSERMLDVLSYKLLNPLMMKNGITIERVKLHRDLSNDNITCPGDLFDRERVVTHIKKYFRT